MGRAIHQGQRTELLDQPSAFFKNTGTESVYGQSLLFQDINVAEKTDSELSRRQPVWPLAKIAKQRQVHLAKKFSNKRRAKLRMVIKESGIAGAGPCLADVPRLDLALPLRIEEIPIRLKFLYVDEFGVVVNGAVGCRPDVIEYVLAFRVGVLVLFLIPLRLIRHLGQYQRGLYWVERLGRIKLLIIRIRPRAHHVGDILLRASLGKQSLPKLVAPSCNRYELDVGKLFFKIRQDRFIAADVDIDLSFLPRRLKRFLPFLLPRRIRLPSNRSVNGG